MDFLQYQSTLLFTPTILCKQTNEPSNLLQLPLSTIGTIY